MFEVLKNLLAASAKGVSVIFNQDGTVTVTVFPKVAEGTNAVLQAPLVLTGTVEELDEQFASILADNIGKRLTLAEQVAATNAVMEAAATEVTAKATKAVAKASKPAAAKTPTVVATASADSGDGDGDGDGDESNDEEETGASSVTSEVAPATATADNLWS